jgi:hypothetical protein
MQEASKLGGRPERKLELELEGLRGVCASLVVLSHWGEFFPQREGLVAYVAEIPRPFGFLAVIVFFMLSGFVIGRATPPERSGRAVAEYLLRRFIRIYPIYLVAPSRASLSRESRSVAVSFSSTRRFCRTPRWRPSPRTARCGVSTTR